MADDQNEIEVANDMVEIVDDKPSKKKRQLSKEQLEKLAIAREKANKVRKENAAFKRKEKELAQLEKQAKSAHLDKKSASFRALE
jgi:hypothetical protein